MRVVTRLLCAAGLVFIMAMASACGGQAQSNDTESLPGQESGFSQEAGDAAAEETQSEIQLSDPIEFP